MTVPLVWDVQRCKSLELYAQLSNYRLLITIIMFLQGVQTEILSCSTKRRTKKLLQFLLILALYQISTYVIIYWFVGNSKFYYHHLSAYKAAIQVIIHHIINEKYK